MSLDQLDDLRAIIDELEGAEEPDDVANLHRRFQALVGDATGNETLSSILGVLQLRGGMDKRGGKIQVKHIAEILSDKKTGL